MKTKKILQNRSVITSVILGDAYIEQETSVYIDSRGMMNKKKVFKVLSSFTFFTAWLIYLVIIKENNLTRDKIMLIPFWLMLISRELLTLEKDETNLKASVVTYIIIAISVFVILSAVIE